MDDVVAALARIHQNTFLPEFERIVHASEQRLTQRLEELFGSLAQQLDRLDGVLLHAQVKRIGRRLGD